MRLIFAAAAMFFSGYVMIMYESPWCMELIVFGCLIIVVSYIISCFMKHAITIDFSVKNNVVQKGKRIPVLLVVKNKSYLPIQNINVEVFVERTDHSSRRYFHVQCAVDGKETAYVELFLESGYCGFVSVKADKCEVWDYLKLFKRRIKCDIASAIIVIPEIYPASVEVVSGFRYFTGSGDTYSEVESGDDPSEVFEVRNYRAGDKMQKIHWKLSARNDDLFVKDYSEPVGFAIVLVLDFGKGALSELDFDSMMTIIFSISDRLIQDGYTHYIAWIDNGGSWRRFKIGSEEAIYSAMPYLLKSVAGTAKKNGHRESVFDIYQLYNEQFGRESYHTMIHIDDKLNVYKNEFIERKMNADALERDLLDINLEI